jgi:hypothetical protein
VFSRKNARVGGHCVKQKHSDRLFKVDFGIRVA